ncbi:MAG TPA: acyl-CoA dehydrogenase family protein [Acidimicrobiales bacterium]|nr:acyl-CoA dehydrogenase family protein [Acidimicrobiales bacterium]
MDRRLFTAEHDLFRRTVAGFVRDRIQPNLPAWEAAALCDRDIWPEAGALGLLGLNVDDAYGGGGTDDFRYNVVLNEELTRAGAIGVGFTLANDVISPYLTGLATDEQRRRWLPGFCRGETVVALAMTEPDAGSDVRGITTTAVPDGGGFVLNGQKTFISSGVLADLVIVAARTGSDRSAEGFTLLVVERGMDGFTRGRNLEKIGRKAQDTAELFFTDVRVPAANVLGDVGQGFGYLMRNLAQERLTIAVTAVAASEVALEMTLGYAKDRIAFGRPIGTFQHNRFLLAELATEVAVARTFVDRCVEDHLTGGLSGVDAAMAKWWTTELEKRVVDACLQLHGGYGYMAEHPIAKAYVDARVQTIHGGTTEIMKEIIGRSLGL